MTCNKDLLSCIDSSISSDITLGNDSLVKVQGKGTVPILTKQNEKKDLREHLARYMTKSQAEN
jgi:hypothetical protein